MGTELDLVLVAGGRIDGEFAEEAGTCIKALARVGEENLLARTMRAYEGTGCIRSRVLVGPEELRHDPTARQSDALLLERGNALSNLLAALEWLEQSRGRAPDRVLVSATDLPFLNPASVLRFIRSCPSDAELCLPVVEKTAFESAFPGVKRDYVTLRDGQWKVGGVVMVRAPALLAARPHLERIFAARKSPLALARLLGWRFVAKLLIRRATVPELERKVGALLGCRTAALVTPDADLAFDIDHLEAYRGAQEWTQSEGKLLQRAA